MPTCLTCGRPKASNAGDLCRRCLMVARNAARSQEQIEANAEAAKAGTAAMSRYDQWAMRQRMKKDHPSARGH